MQLRNAYTAAPYTQRDYTHAEIVTLEQKLSKALHDLAAERDRARRAEAEAISMKMQLVALKGRPLIESERVICAVCEAWGTTLAELRTRSRARIYCYPRHAAAHLLRKYTALSSPRIGALIGLSDHTTILHGARKAQKLALEDKDFAAKMARAEAMLGAANG